MRPDVNSSSNWVIGSRDTGVPPRVWTVTIQGGWVHYNIAAATRVRGLESMSISAIPEAKSTLIEIEEQFELSGATRG